VTESHTSGWSVALEILCQAHEGADAMLHGEQQAAEQSRGRLARDFAGNIQWTATKVNGCYSSRSIDREGTEDSRSPKGRCEGNTKRGVFRGD
jgi:hypothetical protein